MFKNKLSGKFIAIEGLDGCGASTQVELVKSYLKSQKTPIIATSEPTGDIVGSIIRGYLNKEYKLNSPEALQLLFAADRANHLAKEIVPKLSSGINVISDRYFLSSLAYGSLDVDTNWLAEINSQFILPDLTIILRISAKTSASRIKKDRVGIELFNNEEKITQVWSAYEKLTKQYPNIIIVDGEKTVEEVFEEIKIAIDKLIK
ncbi:MAG: dTMP kinase [bacterium]